MDDRGELPAEARRAALAALVAERGYVRVSEVRDHFGVSEVTVRSDLRALDEAGLVRRVHGGAMPVPGTEREAPVETAAERDAELKRAIGRRAAALVANGSSVLLDVGSTTLAVARALVARRDLTELTVITNGLSIALALEAAIPRFTVIVTGGTLRPLQHSLVAPLAANTLPELHADLAILGGNGIAKDGAVTNLNLPEAEIKRAMVTAATRRVLVADASKWGQRHLGRIGALADFDTLVTAGDPAAVEALRAVAAVAGTRVEVPDVLG
ncbi:MAG: DeoR family transcriptional regulator [Leifsonia sp.]|nr:DeoR family transcriptional regulator [Leifsonia sp.]|tara:strand:+ start:12905 stop:13714 length:810 start_codon:yes stop_codon:yes gene_type:complete